MSNSTNYGEMIQELGKVIQYMKDYPEEFTNFCTTACCYRDTCKVQVRRYKHNKLTLKTKLDRSKCPIFSKPNPVADFDRRIKLAIIAGDV